MPTGDWRLLEMLRRCGGDPAELARRLSALDEEQATASNERVVAMNGDELVSRIKNIIYRHAQVISAIENGPLSSGERAIIVVVREFEATLVECLRWIIDNEIGTDTPVGDDTLVFSVNGLLFGRMSTAEGAEEPLERPTLLGAHDEGELWSVEGGR